MRTERKRMILKIRNNVCGMLNFLKPNENVLIIFNLLRIKSARKKFNIREVKRIKALIEGINLITVSIIFVSDNSIDEPDPSIILEKNLTKKSLSCL